MPNHNEVTLMGHITRDPELRFTPGGLAVLNFTVATNTKRKDADDEVYFAAITAFGNQAEAISKYCQKGDPIFIQGRLQRQTWEDKQTGQKRDKTIIILNNFQFLKGKKQDENQTDDGYSNNNTNEGDIPF
jgi:single-strand DNA-binding protein